MDVDRLMELVAQYWDLAYAEGAEGRTHDTEDGAAQRVLSEIRAAAQALAVPEGWKPIATAPKDGTRILLHWKHRPPRVGWWTSEESGEGWKCDGDQVVPAAKYQADCTRWMPLPAVPQEPRDA